MIEKMEILGNGYKIDEHFKKYVQKRLSKLDRYLPRTTKKNVAMKVTVTEVSKNKGEKYEISTTMNIPGGKIITAKDQCSHVLAGIDWVEAKLSGQIRRYNLETQPHRQKKSWRNLFIKRK